MRLSRWILAVVLGGVALPSFGQLGVYGAFSTSGNDIPNGKRMNGGTVGAYLDSHHFPLVNFGMDFRGVILSGDQNGSIKGGSAGPRMVVHLPMIPLRPYAEGLAGASSVKYGQGSAATDKLVANYGFAVGGDFTILPRIDWRVVEYSYTRYTGTGGLHATNTISTGLVIRIPFL